MRGVKGTTVPYGYSCQQTEIVDGELVACGMCAHRTLNGEWCCQRHMRAFLAKFKRTKRTVIIKKLVFTIE